MHSTLVLTLLIFCKELLNYMYLPVIIYLKNAITLLQLKNLCFSSFYKIRNLKNENVHHQNTRAPLKN